jgi:subtilase family serine protease
MIIAAIILLLAGFISHASAAPPQWFSNQLMPHPVTYLGKYIPMVRFSCQSPDAERRCLSPQDFYKAYNIDPLFSQGITGKGRTIAIIGFGLDPTIKHDLHLFDQYYGLPDPIINVFMPEGELLSLDNLFATETTLDVEMAHAIAPDATINLVLIPNTFSALVNATAYVINNNLGDVLSQSYGVYETANPAFVQAMHQLFVQATQKHITLLAASGDTGAAIVRADPKMEGIVAELGVLYPESDPFVTSVGGTTLSLNAEGKYETETAWNNSSSSSPLGAKNATGGGFSVVFPRPGYQDRILGIGGSRGIPDVAYNADKGGIIIVCSSCGYGPDSALLVAGTSAGSPQWAGIVALADQVAGKRLGFLNPALYDIGTSAAYTTAFHDVQTGDNTYRFSTGQVTGYSAQPGWDPVTGWGSPNVTRLVYQLAG